MSDQVGGFWSHQNSVFYKGNIVGAGLVLSTYILPCKIQLLLYYTYRTTQLSIDDFAEVQEALWPARAKWKNIGIRLKLAVSDLECINAEPGSGIDEKFDRMLSARLKKIEPCTWRDLYDALNHPTVAMSDVANKLAPKLTTTGRLSIDTAARFSHTYVSPI